MMGSWVAKLYDKDNVFVAELPMENLRIEYVQNNVWTAEVKVSYLRFKRWMEKQGTTVANALTAGFRYVDIQRDEVTQFKGILSQPSFERSGTAITITLPFKSWLAYFTRRYITKTYSSTDAGAIAWDMINTAQGETYGDIGITAGTIDTTVSHAPTYQREEIAASIISMSADKLPDGFDFEITHAKALTVKFRIGADKPEIVFDVSDIRSYRFPYQVGLNLTTRVHALGDGYGADQLVEVRDASNTYKDKWYLLEDVQSFSADKETATVQGHGDKILALNQDARLYPLTIQVGTNNVDPTSYSIGDKVTVKIQDIINGLYRIRKKVYNVTDKEEYVDLEFYS